MWLKQSRWSGVCLLVYLISGCHHTDLGYFAAPATTEVQPRPTPDEISSLKPAAETQPQPTQLEKFQLPEFIAATVAYNMRLKVGMEQIHQAHADYVTDSLIPNCQLFSDAQLLPLGPQDLLNQNGPPQYDAMLTVPIDWLLFGKRVAAMEAARWQIDVKEADQTDLVRKTVTQAVLLFYDYLEAKELLKVANEDIIELQKLEALALKNVKEQIGKIDAERVRLAILDANREQHRREAAVDSIKARLRTFIGRTGMDADFDVLGTIDVARALPPLDLKGALELTRKRRPDLLSDERAITQSQAAIVKEESKKYPQVSIQTGFSYQDQVHITGFPNATLFNIGLTTTLPFTDRNQGNILKAYSNLRASQGKLQADTADALAEVEGAVAVYREAYEAVTNDDPASLTKARDVLDHTLEAYQKGDKNILDMLDAVRAYRDRVRTMVSTKTDYWQALHTLNGAMGVVALDPAMAGKK
ncbi:MAG TPA: TolC family protein [Gemmatales bacterium]|nr:TolC family protein [Gemmatales bacterium]